MLPGQRPPLVYSLIASGLITLFLAQGFYASSIKSPAFDETGDLAAGLSYIQTGEIRANLQHPPLLKELAGISLRAGGVTLPKTPETWQMLASGGERAVGSALIASSGPDRVMFWSRLPFLLLAAALGGILWWWGRRLVGETAAIAALFLYALDPTILAHGYLATMDVGLAAFAVLFFYALWNYLEAPTTRSLGLTGIALGLLLCTKFSALFLVPVAAVLLFIHRRATAKTTVSALAMMGLIAILIVQALYLSAGGLFLYTRGLDRVNADHNPDYLVFLGGQLQHSFVSYFPIAYLLKEPIAAIALAALGLYAVRKLPATWFLTLPPLAIFAAHMAFADDLGIRYIIPALPFLYLIGGVGAAWLIGKGLPGRIAAGALGAWLVFASVSVSPDHLSYFNELAGGTRNGPQWLDDSNVDWGQGLKQLKDYVKDRPFNLAYFGSMPPAAYGLNAGRLDLTKPPVPGLNVVSAHFVARAQAEWLRHPTAIVGHALYVYEIPSTPAR